MTNESPSDHDADAPAPLADPSAVQTIDHRPAEIGRLNPMADLAAPVCRSETVLQLLQGVSACQRETPSPSQVLLRSDADQMPQPRDMPARYELVGEIARGGMGAVFKGRDTDLGRDIAIKVILNRHSNQSELLERFVEEAQIAGQLQHPGVVPVYELGLAGDHRLYFTMKLVEGQTLAQLLEERAIAAGAVTADSRFLTIFEQVCQTIAYAHARGVIHRDLKPSNIMVGAFGEVQVMDWGLAKVLPRSGGAKASPPRTKTTHGGVRTVRSGGPAPVAADVIGSGTEAGAVLGTPAFMAPEQACGASDTLDERCDVFGLGAVLCCVLTGQPPYTGERAHEILQKAMRAELVESFARLEKCGAEAELIELTRRCLAPQRDERPRDASAVAAAMERYRTGVQERLRQAELERAAARVQTAEERKRREVEQARARAERQRWRATVAAVAALLLLLAGAAAAGLWYQQVEAERETTRVEAERRAEIARLEMNQRRQQAEQQARTALQQAREVRRQLHQQLAQPQGVFVLLNNPAVWRGQLQTIQSHLREARARAETAEGAVAGPLGRDLDEGQHRFEADQNDYRLAVGLEKVRLDKANWVAGQFDNAGAVKAYGQAFHKAGLSIDKANAGLADRIRQSPIREQLVAALEDWALAAWNSNQLGAVPAQASTANQQLAGQLLALARRSDPDGASSQVRDVELWRQPQELVKRAEELKHTGAAGKRPVRPSPQSYFLVGALLCQSGPAGEAWLREGQAAYPNDFWLNVQLGTCLWHKHLPQDGIGFLRAAVAVRPDSSAAYNNLGNALAELNDLKGAGQAFRRAIALDSRHAYAHSNLGHVLHRQGNLEGAIQEYRQAIALHPKFAAAHLNLGIVLHARGDLAAAVTQLEQARALDPKNVKMYRVLGIVLKDKRDLTGAMEQFREVIRRDARDPEAHFYLGLLLNDKGDLKGALDHYRRAVELKGDLIEARSNLGLALFNAGDLTGAVAELRRAIDLNPKFAPAYCHLGPALQMQNDAQGALQALRQAVQLDPKFVAAWYNLGKVLDLQGDRTGAAAAYQKALALDPNYPDANCNLGLALMQNQGRFLDALKLLERGHEVGSRRPGWSYPSAQWVQQCRQLVQLEKRAVALSLGLAQSNNPDELLDLARFCWRFHRPHAAARLYAAAFALKPALAEDQANEDRQTAALAAALAGSGRGHDADQLEAKGRASLRRQALDWLHADLKLLSRTITAYLDRAAAADPPASPLQKLTAQAQKSGPAGVLTVCDRLQRWQADPAFLDCRDNKLLTSLPAAERQDWHELWKAVQALDKRAHSCFAERQFPGRLTTENDKQVHEISLQPGKAVAIDLDRNSYPVSLRLEDGQGKAVAESATVAGSQGKARLLITPETGGTYRLVVTALQLQTRGQYVLRIREFAGK
jgi:serine/threonine protein kinase/Flp pilus assembly protein TadD